MYHMKNIISHDNEISLPKCMYLVKNLNETTKSCEININISDQVIKLIKASNSNMAELEQRQDQLLKKLDILYERIKTISAICTSNNVAVQQIIPVPQEIVLNINPDSLPIYLNVFLKDNSIVPNISWHIHSSVPHEKIEKIKAFMKKIKLTNNDSKINFRLIFKCGQSNAELKYSSLTIPIVGSVNILRYFCLVYPTAVAYDLDDYYMDGLLDLCHLLESAPEKNKDQILQKLFTQSQGWIYNNSFSIVDLATYNVVKQLRNKPKSVPKEWFEKCDKMCT